MAQHGPVSRRDSWYYLFPLAVHRVHDDRFVGCHSSHRFMPPLDLTPPRLTSLIPIHINAIIPTRRTQLPCNIVGAQRTVVGDIAIIVAIQYQVYCRGFETVQAAASSRSAMLAAAAHRAPALYCVVQSPNYCACPCTNMETDGG